MLLAVSFILKRSTYFLGIQGWREKCGDRFRFTLCLLVDDVKSASRLSVYTVVVYVLFVIVNIYSSRCTA